MAGTATRLRYAVGVTVSAVVLAAGCSGGADRDADATGRAGTATDGAEETGSADKAGDGQRDERQDSEKRGGGPGGDGADGPAPAPAPTVEADPAKVPRTRETAAELIRRTIVGPEQFGPEARRGTPYESDPATWSVLGSDCVWQREPLPRRVLATLTRHFERPAADGKGPVRMSATVTVHPATEDAAWEQAGMLEEALGCSEQTLGEGEKLSNLLSNASAWGEHGNNYAEDSLLEVGTCTSDEEGGPYPYLWQQATFGPVVVSVSACAGKGWDVPALMRTVQQPVPRMLLRAEARIGRPVGGTTPKQGESAQATTGAQATGSAATEAR